MRSALITAFTAIVLLLSSLATAAVAQVSREVRVELAGYARGIRAATLTMDIDLVGNYDLVFRVEPTAAARVFGMQGMTLRGRGAQTATISTPVLPIIVAAATTFVSPGQTALQPSPVQAHRR